MIVPWIKDRTRMCPCQKNRESAAVWKIFSLIGMVFSVTFAILALILKRKNDVYMKALIDLSDQLPEEEDDADSCEEDDADSRSEWQSAHAPANQRTVEERLSEQRLHEE